MELSGVLSSHSETGTEGIVWAFQDAKFIGTDGKWSYDGLHALRDGDHIKAFNDDGSIRWEGTIALEYKRRWRTYPLNPSQGQQEVEGYWVHGFQVGVEPEDWFHMFEDGPKAVLTPK